LGGADLRGEAKGSKSAGSACWTIEKRGSAMRNLQARARRGSRTIADMEEAVLTKTQRRKKVRMEETRSFLLSLLKLIIKKRGGELNEEEVTV